jgi:hypothetical protein
VFDVKAFDKDEAEEIASDRLGFPPHQVIRRPWEDVEGEVELNDDL